MKTRKKVYLLVGLLLFSILFSAKATIPVNASSDIIQGDGSVANPYQISTAEQLSIVNYDLQSNYKLIKDIDLDGKEWTPIGISSVPFSGTFDGNGYKINNLKLDKNTGNIGLFAFTSGSTIKNVIIVNANIKGTNTIGALISSSVNTKIENCSVEGTGSVTGEGDTGGLVGYIKGGSLIKSYSSIKVNGTSAVGGLAGRVVNSVLTQNYTTEDVTGSSTYVGGLVGYMDSSTVTQNHTTGDVTGSISYVGGLVGNMNSCTVTQNHTTGDVTGSASYVGGLVGCINPGTVTQNYTTGDVTGGSYTGGLVGYIKSATVTQSYATGSVTGSATYIGGLVGNTDYSISESYATGSVQGKSLVGGLVGSTILAYNQNISNCFALGSVFSSDTTNGNVGGLIGSVSGPSTANNIKNCYAAGKVLGTGSDVGGLFGILNTVTFTNNYYDSIKAGVTVKRPYDVGRFTTAMKQQSTFSGWDFTNIWKIEEGLTYPYLKNLDDPFSSIGNISLDKTLLILKIGESQKLIATGVTSGIVWTSSDEGVAKVNSEGNVTAVGIGKAVITAKIEGTDISASCEVNVKGIVLDKTTLAMIKGESQKLTVTGAESSSVIWTSSNEAVAKVNSEGNVTAVGIGKAVITAKIEGTDISASCEVNVKGIVLDKTTLAMIKGESQKLTVTGAESSSVIWTSSNEAVAKVDSEGNVTAVGIGKAVVTVKVEGMDILDSCTVTVSDNLKVLDLEQDKSKIQLNKKVNVYLIIDNIKEIAAEDVSIKYDSSKLKFVGIDEVDGIMLVKNDIKTGELRFILASKGLENVVKTKKVLLNLYFEGIALGDALVEITSGKISDGIDMEKDLDVSECGQATITVENSLLDVNKDGKFSLLDMAIDARHFGENPATLPQYNTDIVLNQAIDSDDLIQIAKYMLEDPNYN